MGKGLYITLVLSLSFIFITSSGCQDSNRFAVAGTGGTLGLGGEFSAKIAPDIKARVGISQLDFDFDEEEIDDVEYDLGVDFSSISALVDWHIFDDSFHVTGGFISMNNEIEMDARPTQNVEIGNTTYTPAQVGTLTGCVEIDGLSPYVGIGWGNPFTSNRRWGFTFDMGVAFTDSPDVSLTSTGIVSQADLSNEIKEIEDDLDEIKFYPVLTLGLFYRF